MQKVALFQLDCGKTAEQGDAKQASAKTPEGSNGDNGDKPKPEAAVEAKGPPPCMIDNQAAHLTVKEYSKAGLREKTAKVNMHFQNWLFPSATQKTYIFTDNV